MGQLHIVDANLLTPLVVALPVTQHKLECMLENAGLAPTLSDAQRGIIPLQAAEKMIYASAKLVDRPTFEFQMLPISTPALDSYMASLPMQTGLTGLDAAYDLAANIDRMLTGDRISGTVHSSAFWIYRTNNASSWTADWSVVHYSLAAFLSGMRQLFGGSLMPRAVCIPHTAKPNALPADLLGIPQLRETQVTGLAFRIQDLCSIVKTRRIKTLKDQTANSVPLSSADKSSVAACAIEFLRSGTSDMLAQRMAKSFGMSVRSYQRRLKDIGTTHSELIDTARLELALRMLVDDDCSVTEIAMELGYSYPGHFARFFKQKVGLSPTEYRKIEVSA